MCVCVCVCERERQEDCTSFRIFDSTRSFHEEIFTIEMRNKYALVFTLIKYVYGAIDYENHR